MKASTNELEELYKLETENKALREALTASSIAIDDWLHQYASELCNEKLVEEAYTRIMERGGTLHYIATIQEANRKILNKIPR